jgi:hypothetical protein
MSRVIFQAALVLAAAALPTVVYGGCSCVCSGGVRQASCSNPYEIPPICSQTLCPFGPVSTAPNLAPITGPRKSSCSEVKQCDTYGHCEWRRRCP